MKKYSIVVSASLAVASAGTLAAVQGAAASTGERLADRPCQWSVTQSDSGDAIELSRQGKRIPLKPVNDDSAKRAFVGDGVSVEVLYGMSKEDIARTLAEQAEKQEELAAASLAEVVETGADVEENETFQGEGVTEDLVPIAYRVADNEVEEAGVVSDSGPARQKVAECVKKAAGADSELVLETPTERITLPKGQIATGVSTAAVDAYPTTSSAVRYRTFIPGATVTAPCGKFKGDDRGFSNSYAASNRTRASIFFNWPSATIDATRGVGATHRLAANGFSAATKTASASGIQFHTAMMGGAYGRIGINHSVGNPLCSIAGPITYNVIVEAWKGDGTRVSGTAVKAPNHEAVWYPQTEATGKSIFRKSGASFYCLSAPINCGRWNLWEVYSG